jgi:hypothetical protein
MLPSAKVFPLNKAAEIYFPANSPAYDVVKLLVVAILNYYLLLLL